MIRFHAERCKLADIKPGELYWFDPPHKDSQTASFGRAGLLVFVRTEEDLASDGVAFEDVWRIIVRDDSETDPADAS